MDTNVEKIADLAVRAQGRPEIIEAADGRKFLVTPTNTNVKEVLDDPYGMIVPPPVRIKQPVLVQTVDSLVDYVNRFKGENTILFADIESNRIVAVIDYHGKGAPAHLDHRVSLDMPFSEEWKLWSAIHKRKIGQLEFAQFIEENSADITAPTGADLLEICRDIHAVRKANFKKVVRLSGGVESFEFSENEEAKAKGGTVEVPSKFELTLPVYFGGRSVNLFAFLRWKTSEDGLLLGVDLNRQEHVRQAVFKEIVTDAAERTACPAVFGKPKAS